MAKRNKRKKDEPDDTSKEVTVRALAHLHEDTFIAKGEIFTTTEQRAAALGNSVEIIPDAPEEKKA